MGIKFKVTYDSPPISEVVKTCDVELFDGGDLSFEEAAELVSKINSLLGRPIITAQNIISVDKYSLDDSSALDALVEVTVLDQEQGRYDEIENPTVKN